jgi:exodeoxyribonuclease-3
MSPPMRIATYNVNGLNARIDYLQHWLRAVQPDVVGLQELKLEDDKFPTAKLAELGYRACTHGQKSWNGVGVLTRVGCEVRQVGLPGQAEMGSRLLAVDVEGITFVTVYCPNGKDVTHEDFPRKLAWYDDLRSWIVMTFDPAQPLVVCGDFNIVPAAIDSWDEAGHAGHIFHTVEERARFAALLDWGLVDVWRAKKPDDPGHTWWDYRAGAFHKKQGLRIDLILATRPVVERVRDVGFSRDWRKKVEGLTPSDHAPVWADLE